MLLLEGLSGRMDLVGRLQDCLNPVVSNFLIQITCRFFVLFTVPDSTKTEGMARDTAWAIFSTSMKDHMASVRVQVILSALFLFVTAKRLLGHNKFALKAGMTVSNEPGYYEDGRYGIRTESIVLVREVKTPNNFNNKGYFGFEHVTL